MDTFWHIPFSEYLIVLAISFFSVYSDMLTAIAVGCAASVVLFAFKFHEVWDRRDKSCGKSRDRREEPH